MKFEKCAFTLAEGTSYCNLLPTKVRFGFTLAEVLITLGIIGVVAAMTIPTLIAKNQERITVNKVKKFYSLINQAFQLAREENGDVDGWDIVSTSKTGNKESAEKFATYIKPHLKIAVDCGTSPCFDHMMKDTMVFLNGDSYHENYSGDHLYKIVLMDNSVMWFRTQGFNICDSSDGTTQNVCGLVFYDTNGKLKPNIMGKDIFVFYVLPNSVIPHQGDSCYLNSKGWGCSKYILNHNDMHYPKVKPASGS